MRSSASIPTSVLNGASISNADAKDRVNRHWATAQPRNAQMLLDIRADTHVGNLNAIARPLTLPVNCGVATGQITGWAFASRDFCDGPRKDTFVVDGGRLRRFKAQKIVDKAPNQPAGIWPLLRTISIRYTHKVAAHVPVVSHVGQQPPTIEYAGA